MKNLCIIIASLLVIVSPLWAQNPKPSPEPQFESFWTAFRGAVLAKNLKAIEHMTVFPLKETTTKASSTKHRTLTSDDFLRKDFAKYFNADITTAVRSMKRPVAYRGASFDRTCKSFSANWQLFKNVESDSLAPKGATRKISCNFTWLYKGDDGRTLDYQYQFALVDNRFVLYHVSIWEN
jgi:hypothetical protein